MIRMLGTWYQPVYLVLIVALIVVMAGCKSTVSGYTESGFRAEQNFVFFSRSTPEQGMTESTAELSSTVADKLIVSGVKDSDQGN